MLHHSKIIYVIKVLAIIFWGGILWFVLNLFWSTGMDWRGLPKGLRYNLHHAGSWGPLMLIGAHIIRTFLFLPSSILEVAAGSVYGPYGGTIINIIGTNISAAIAFWIGRFFGRDIMSKNEHGKLKEYDAAISRDGFMATLITRLLFVPFDIVNLLAGVTGMKFKHYMLGTFLGTLPAIVTFTVAGDRIGKPRGLIVFGVLAVLVVVLIYCVKRHPWAKIASLLHTKKTD